MISVVDLLDKAVRRVQKERERFGLALRAADAGAWEWTPPDRLIWDPTFYHLLGLDPTLDSPSLELFVSRVHPSDREKMRNSGNAIMAGEEPSPRDEFRFLRPDGTTGWLENHRAVAFDGVRHIIGITQDITRRKENRTEFSNSCARSLIGSEINMRLSWRYSRNQPPVAHTGRIPSTDPFANIGTGSFS